MTCPDTPCCGQHLGLTFFYFLKYVILTPCPVYVCVFVCVCVCLHITVLECSAVGSTGTREADRPCMFVATYPTRMVSYLSSVRTKPLFPKILPGIPRESLRSTLSLPLQSWKSTRKHLPTST